MSHNHDHADDERGPPSDHEVLSRAMQELLEEKGILTAEQIRSRMEQFDKDFPTRGVRVIAHAWVDPRIQEAAAGRRQGRVRRVRHRPRGGPPDRGREHARGAQRRRLHALLVLSARPPRHAAHPVQEARTTAARGARPARRAEGVPAPCAPRASPVRVQTDRTRTCATSSCHAPAPDRRLELKSGSAADPGTRDAPRRGQHPLDMNGLTVPIRLYNEQ